MKHCLLPLMFVGLVGCKTTVHDQKVKHISRCMEIHQSRGETYSDAMTVCNHSAEKFLGSIK